MRTSEVAGSKPVIILSRVSGNISVSIVVSCESTTKFSAGVTFAIFEQK